MSRNILILSASAGAGHVRAADALEKGFHLVDPTVNVTNADALGYTNALFRKLYSQAYIDLVNKSPDVLGWIYDYLDEPYKHAKRRLAFDKLNTRPLIKLIERVQPDAIVCTHFLPAEIVSYLKAKGKLSVPHSVVVTDFDMHAMWLCRQCDTYFVALDETREHLLALGVDERNVIVTGIPIDPRFAERVDRAEARRRLGLDEHLPTLLISAGGFGVGPVEHLVTALLSMKCEAQAVVICGRNEELKSDMEQLVASKNSFTVRVHVTGYTTEMQLYMSAADLLVGKPGGLTTSEALAKGLGFVIVNPIPGQEERNSDHLLEQQVAVRCNNLPVIAWKVEKLLCDHEKLKAMQERATALGKPDAARTIAQHVLSTIT